MKWHKPNENIAHYRADGYTKTYDVKQYFLLDCRWVIEIGEIRIPATFKNAKKAMKICELIEGGEK